MYISRLEYLRIECMVLLGNSSDAVNLANPFDDEAMGWGGPRGMGHRAHRPMMGKGRVIFIDCCTVWATA